MMNSTASSAAPNAVASRINPAVAWVVCALVAATQFGNFYVYDSIGPVADLLQRQRGLSDTQLGVLNAIYALPNVILILVGGVLVDRLGAARMTVLTAAVCAVGALLTALSPNFFGMATGRLLFGIGAETFSIATMAAVARYFGSTQIALAMALCLAVGRLGSYAADLSPAWFPMLYQGWQGPLLLAAAMAVSAWLVALVYAGIDRRHGGALAAPVSDRFNPRDLLQFGRAYWYLVVLCVLWYSVILAFRSTFSIKYFQQVHGLDLAHAGELNGNVYLAAVFATPFFGWLCDRLRRYAPLLAVGAALLPLSLAVMAWVPGSLGLSTVLIGVSYSLVPAVMWPLASRLVAPARFGTAIGLMWVVQNAGVAGANLVAGWLNDRAGASAANPSGYDGMLLFFGGAAVLGLVFALLLWWSAGRREHEHAPAV